MLTRRSDLGRFDAQEFLRVVERQEPARLCGPLLDGWLSTIARQGCE